MRRLLTQAALIPLLEKEQPTLLSLLLSPNTLVSPVVVEVLIDLISGCVDDRSAWETVTSLMVNVEEGKRMMDRELNKSSTVCDAIIRLFFTPIASYLSDHCSSSLIFSGHRRYAGVPAAELAHHRLLQGLARALHSHLVLRHLLIQRRYRRVRLGQCESHVERRLLPGLQAIPRRCSESV